LTNGGRFAFLTVRAAHAAGQGEDAAEEEDSKDRVTFDDTSEFVRNVTLENLVQVKREPRARSTSAAPAAAPVSTGVDSEDKKPVIVKIESVDLDVKMEDGEEEEDEEDEILAEMALREGLSLEEMRIKMDAAAQVKAEEEVRSITFGPWNALCTNERIDPQVMVSKPEPSVSGGVAGALALLRQQGAVKTLTAEDQERERVQRERDLWLADHRRRVAKRELERIKARGGNKDQAQREWENKMREQQEAREALSAYANYKPDINIQYTDEFGRGEWWAASMDDVGRALEH
jgi:U4/U6.U5 tri-snRNP-associated protein 1